MLVVGIGASAGGLGAMSELFRGITEEPKFAIVVVQHLSPEGPAMLGQILAGKSSIPVRDAEDDMEIEAGHAYVAPPQSLLVVEEGRLRMRSSQGTEQRRRPIDALFRSLADEVGEGAVGVLMSGSDADGTVGLQEIATAGGFTIAQSLTTAEFETMPGSAIESGAVDLELAPAEIPEAIECYYDQLLRMRRDSLQKEHQSIIERLDDVAHYVLQETGHDFTHYKTSTLVRRIQRRMRILHISDIDSYLERVAADADEASALFREILISVTSFFRDPEPFAVFAEEVVPAICEGRGSSDSVRVWVPGCATGEEAYSIAILIREYLDDIDRRHWPKIQIFATDIDVDALQIGRRGLYSASIESQLTQERLERFFMVEEGSYRIKDEIREMCLFAEHNIIRDPPFVDLDLVSCRNLLIYLNSHLQEQVLLLFHHSLRPKGFLFLGTSETVSPQADLFRDHDVSQRIWRNTSASAAPRPTFPIEELDIPKRIKLGPRVNSTGEPDLHEQFQRVLAEKYAPRAAVVRRDGRIIYAAEGLERYLEIPHGQFHVNLVKMASSGLRMGLRAALRKSVETGDRVVHDNLTFRSPEGTQPARVVVDPMPGTDESTGLYLVVFEEPGPSTEAAQQALEEPDREAERIIDQLEHELECTRDNLERTVQDLETANEELKSSNEELRSMNEELHSSNEELETSQEEINEANQKLMQAKSDLENLLKSAQFATLFLSEDRVIKMFTPAIEEIYGLRESDVGRPLEEIADRAIDMPDLPDVEDVYSGDTPIIDEMQTVDGSWFIRRVSAYVTEEGEAQGLVVTFSDVTNLKEASAKLAQRTEQLEEAKSDAEAASRAKSEFLANMSHEIRTPMTAILGFTEILRQRLEESDYREMLDTIERNARFLLDIINDILDISKVEEGTLQLQKKAVHPRSLVEEVVSLMQFQASEKDLSLAVTISEEVPERIETDPTRLRQILLNLIGNAIKFTEEGGVDVGVDYEGGENPVLVFEIQDTGIGIAEKERDELFQSFAQADTSGSREYEGTGLGLTISNRLAERLGGDIQVESELGVGSTFTVTIAAPIVDDHQPEPEEGESETDSAPRLDARVLVVDDYEEICDLVRHILESAGASVETATNGKKALEEVADAENSGRPFDLVFMDVQMPQMNGYETTQELRERGYDRPIVALTAAAMSRDFDRCMEAGCTAHLPKPIDPVALVEVVAEYSGEE